MYDNPLVSLEKALDRSMSNSLYISTHENSEYMHDICTYN